MATVEAAGINLEVKRGGGLSATNRWINTQAYEAYLGDIQDRAREKCPKGVLCCMNVTLDEFTVSLDGEGISAAVSVECSDASCGAPQLVGETAMNHVLGEGDTAIQAPLA